VELLWDKCLSDIKKEVKPQLFKTMFKDLKLVYVDSEVAKIKASDRIVKEYLEKNYLPLIRKVISKHIGKEIEVKILLPEEVHKPLQLELNLFKSP
jgi:chromosomal replication initiator protein